MALTREEVAAVLKNIYHNGFANRRGAYRIRRETLRDIFEIARVEGGTLEVLDQILRDDGYFLYPLDVRDYSAAQEFVVDRLSRAGRIELADDRAIRRADRIARSTEQAEEDE